MPKVSEKYLDLIRAFPLRPIRTDAELDRAVKVMHQLIDRGIENLSSDEDAYLGVLSDLIEKYEHEHHPIEPLPPHQMLSESIRAKGVTQTAVSKATGIPISTISELIARKREFNVSHVGKLSGYFGLAPDAFLHKKLDEEPAKRKRMRRAL